MLHTSDEVKLSGKISTLNQFSNSGVIYNVGYLIPGPPEYSYAVERSSILFWLLS